VNIDVQRLVLSSGAQILTRAFDAGSGGNLTLNAAESVEIAGTSAGGFFGSTLSTGVEFPETTGNGGNLTIVTKELIVKDGGALSTSTRGIGKAGDLTIRAADKVEVNTAILSTASEPQATGDAGNLTIETRQLNVQTQAGRQTEILAGTFGKGNAGDLLIKAFEKVTASEPGTIISTVVGPNTGGKGGNLTIETPVLQIQNLAQIGTGTLGSGNGGNLLVKASESLQLNDGFLTTQSQSLGNAGNLTIETRELIVNDGAQIATGTEDGKAGTLTVTASKFVEVRGVSPTDAVVPSGLFASTNGAGDAGSLEINTPKLFIQDGGRVVVSTVDQGQGGTLTVNAKESIEVSGSSINSQSALFAETSGTGKAGSINLDTGKLTLQDGGLVSAATRSQGEGGSIVVNAPDINISSSSASGFTSGILTSTSGSGKGGDITLTTNNLLVSNSTIDARTSADGEGGSILVRTDSFKAASGGRLLSTTEGSKPAGDITVNARNVTLVEPGSGLFANTSVGATGQGGGVTMQVGDLFVRDGAEVNVSSLGSGNAGSLTINAEAIELDNQGKLQAATALGEGGNLNLQVRDLILMRRNSLISVRADNNGNGGNININAPFIVAVPREDSNIIANAFGGRGGNINITTNGIYGLQYRPVLTAFSDINASSEFGVNGTVQINEPDVDPSRGLVELPTNLIDASGQIDTACTPGSRQVASSFIITGRGGLPLNPREFLSSQAVDVDWVSLSADSNNLTTSVPLRDRQQQETSTNKENTSHNKIVEAQGLVIDANGNINLVAQAPTTTPQTSGFRSVSCPAS
jgi:large exoprotein involved in heme utilization and adhesion